MMNLIAGSSERAPSAPSSTASESPGKTRYQDEKYYRTVRPVVCAHSSSYSEWNVDKAWSSHEWKSDELMEDRTRRPVDCSQRASQPRSSYDGKNFNVEEDVSHYRTGRPVVCSERAHQFVIENEEAESDLSLGSRSFLHRVNDQVRKRQKQSLKDATQDSDKHSLIWRMFVSSTMQASVFMGKNYLGNLFSVKNTEDLTMKQMFNISEKLISEQSDEIYGVKTINWEDSSWKYLSLIGDEERW